MSRAVAEPSVILANSRSISRTGLSSCPNSVRVMTWPCRSATPSRRDSDLSAIDGRPQQPLTQQARAHRRLRPVDHPQQRRLDRAAEQRLDQLEISHRHRIERHPILLAVVGRRIEVLEPRRRCVSRT